MRISKIISIILILVVSVTCISGCGSSNEKSIVGQWYNEKGKCLDIRSDGTWKLDGSYGTGTYKLLDDKETFEFTDFYGDTQESKINNGDLGQYIDFGYYGDFYKDSYPSEEKIAEVKAKNAISLNPFDGIKYEVSGISPYCKISINNKDCSNEVQKYITYELDKDYYANDETAVITAKLSSNTGGNSYLLSSDNAKYNVLGQPEYVTSVEQIDIDVIKKEATDKINALISASIGTEKICNEDISYRIIYNTDTWNTYRDQSGSIWGGPNITQATSKLQNIYFSSLKSQKEDQFSSSFPYNMLSFVCSLDISTNNYFTIDGNRKDVNIDGKMYINISAINVIKQSNGKITWNDEKCDFSLATSFDGIDNLISNTVMSNSDNYNVSKIEVQ